MSTIRQWAQEARRILRLLPWTLRWLWLSHRGATVSVSLLTLLQSVIPVAQLWVTKLLVDQVVFVTSLSAAQRVGSPLQTIWLYVGLEAAVLAAGLVIGLAAGHSRNILQEHLVYQVQLKVLQQSARLDLAAYEAPEYYDQLYRAQEGALYGPVQLLSAVLVLAQTSLTLLTVSGLILAYSPGLVVVLLATTLPGFWALMHYGRRRFIVFNDRTPDGRRAEYLSSVLSSDVYAKEVRVWGLTDYLLDQIQALRRRFRQENIDLSRGQALASFGGELLSTLGYYAAYVTVVWRVVGGSFTLGDLTLYAGVFSRSQALFENLLQAIAEVYQVQLFVEQLDLFLRLEPKVTAPPTTAPPVPRLERGLAVQNLAFAYPGSEQPVLRDVSFHIRPGECVALVGNNGAGKTTLVKCLLRLYDPDGGRIVVDGEDLRQVDPAAWRQQIGVVFQDYARYQLTARENVGFGRLSALNDLPRIRAAAAQSGIDAILEALPEGYETLLGRRFEGGAELSLGQWQRVALARALLRDAPLIILDEPTAALDAQAEYDLYQQWRELTRGRMTVLISHRFSTVRMADRILVLDNGTIVEEGSHEELLARDGQYAYLFRLQAESYQMESAPVTDPQSGLWPAVKRVPVG